MLHSAWGEVVKPNSAFFKKIGLLHDSSLRTPNFAQFVLRTRALCVEGQKKQTQLDTEQIEKNHCPPIRRFEEDST